MKFLKAIISLSAVVLFVSCDKNNNSSVMTRTLDISVAQEVPAPTVASTGSGSAVITYDRNTKQLNYSITFSGLSDSATAAHIHGIGVRGMPAGIFQTFANFPRLKSSVTPYTGFLYIDGSAIKEEDLLAGRYYINIHTKTNPGGEIRGQIEF